MFQSRAKNMQNWIVPHCMRSLVFHVHQLICWSSTLKLVKSNTQLKEDGILVIYLLMSKVFVHCKSTHKIIIVAPNYLFLMCPIWIDVTVIYIKFGPSKKKISKISWMIKKYLKIDSFNKFTFCKCFTNKI